ncbi:hypothetical protein CWI38_1784p0010 [Hamiltosporidium tvaerminnensis]|uniref:Uncharacterized protein n=1 Tax=Hamiltosporidium tvaerminnensis TaxID=1176355 RepID=A0A4Q9LQR4_9MICR|nr:hypothetical protein CWI38_1784p0010 [Hamiltosporidium tvaerminnensis]
MALMNDFLTNFIYTCSDFRLLDESDTYFDDHHMICQDMKPYENNECIIPSVCEEFKKCVRCCEPEFQKCFRYCEPEVQKCVRYCEPEVKKCIHYCEPEVKKCIQYLEPEV